MKATLVMGIVLAIAKSCLAEQVLVEYDWSKLAQSHELLSGVPMSVDGKGALKIVNTNDTPLQAQMLKMVKPPITKKLYAIVGEVKYEGVRGAGYLEMWNYFPPVKPGMQEAAFFSRTLGESGDSGKITGTSNWRRFVLPFDRTGTEERPARLDINLFLPAQGTVFLSPIKLVQYTGAFGQMGGRMADAWWPDWAGGVIGGIAGSVLGCLGGLLTWLASQGKARGFVLASMKTFIVLGILSLAAGCIALGLRQPYGVWFLPILLGVILLAISPSRLKQYQRQYEKLELRKMAALDA